MAEFYSYRNCRMLGACNSVAGSHGWAAWGFACGMGYMSFFGELENLGSTDPSGLPSATVVVIKGVMVTLALAALIATLRVNSSNDSEGRA